MIATVLMVIWSTAGLPPATPPVVNVLSADERAAGWQLLFDGRSLTGWRGFKQQTPPGGWTVVGDALTVSARGGDLITRETYRDFELRFEWRVTAGANSGVFYRVDESSEAIWFCGPEYQIADNAGIGTSGTTLNSAGANYGLHAPPADFTRPVGEYNTARIRVKGQQVEHWLNGQKLCAYEFGDPDWIRRRDQSKFKQHACYGQKRDGHLGLQNYATGVSFRNLKIRRLDK